jgi:hypothetical protein
MRHRFIALFIALACATAAAPAPAQVSVSIGINVPAYPQLVLVPGHPVYYAPQVRANFFFFDGVYWVLQGENWYMSAWFNGPWEFVQPAYVPYAVLRVPVRYYRAPPPYFRGWAQHQAPRWSNHWGPQWQNEHKGWDERGRHAAPAAPLPTYQRRYSGDRYPPPPQQGELQGRNYRYQPRTEAARQHYEKQRVAPVAQQRAPQERPPQERGRGQDKQDRRDERGERRQAH